MMWSNQRVPPTAPPASMTSADTDAAIRAATARLTQAGVESPQADALELLAHAWGISRSEIGRARLRGTPIPAEVLPAFESLLARRAAREPLQHITGLAHFRHLSLAVGPGVFIPRPETELLVSAVIDWWKDRHPDGETSAQRVAIIDACAGSGAVGLSLAAELPHADVTGIEIEPAAAAYAVKNAAAVEATIRAQDSAYRLVEADALSFQPAAPVHVVVSNPPYVAAELQPEVTEVVDYDPATALYGGGENGLDFPQRLIAHGAALLAPGGLLALEHAEYQSAQLRESFAQAGLEKIQTLADYTGRDRITIGQAR